jgi:ABC-2 type transport system permease protein
MKNKIGLIIAREYRQRVKKKSFIITTLLMPILMVLLTALPALMLVLNEPDERNVAVIDDSGVILPNLESNSTVRYFDAHDATKQELLASDSVYGVLIIDRNIVDNPAGVTLLTTESSTVAVNSDITGQMEKIIENRKLRKYNIENLDKILDDVETTVTLRTLTTDVDGQKEQDQSAELSAGLGTLLNFVLYMFILLYGGMVMNSIIEEKNNRVLEIVVSSVNPTQLMLGKVIGVGLVALTQVLIWAAIIIAFATTALQSLLPAAVDASDVAMLSAIMALVSLPFLLKIFAMLIIFLLGGYLFYASVFAAIGAAVDNVQDAAQLQTLGVVPVLFGLIASMSVLADPNGLFAVVCSLVPFTSPMVMMARMPFGVPLWQTVTSIVLLFLSVIFMIWFAAKVYRVGIFMYGKKPTVRDLIRWARYK